MKRKPESRSGNGALRLRVLPAPAAIGFRLDDASRHALAERAARLGLSRHELARHYVLEMLHASEERAALREAIRGLGEQILHLREDLVLVAENLLTAVGKVDPEEMRAWVETNFQ
jgi:hypothetical protein